MNLKKEEIPYHKLAYGYELIITDHDNITHDKYLLYRFLTNRERGLWLQEGNIRKINNILLCVTKRRYKVKFMHPMVQQAKHFRDWPVMYIKNSYGEYQPYIKVTETSEFGIAYIAKGLKKNGSIKKRKYRS